MEPATGDNQREKLSDFENVLTSLLKMTSGIPYQNYAFTFAKLLGQYYDISKVDPTGNFSIAYLLSRPMDKLTFELAFYDGNSILENANADVSLKLSGNTSLASESNFGEQTSSRLRVVDDSTVRFEVRSGNVAPVGGFIIPSIGKIRVTLSSNDPKFSVSVDIPYFGVLGTSKSDTSRKIQLQLISHAASKNYAKNRLPIVHASMEVKDANEGHLELMRFNLVCRYENSISKKPHFDNLSPHEQLKPVAPAEMKEVLEGIPGAAIVNQGGEISHPQGIDQSAKVQIGNITRLFVALALKKLVPDWKDKKHDGSFVITQIAKKHPEVAEQLRDIYSEQNVPSPTISQLLSGTSGLPEDFGIEPDGLGKFISKTLDDCHVEADKVRDPKAEFLRNLKNCELAYLPGSHVCSSNIGWTVLSLLLESMLNSSTSLAGCLEKVATDYGYNSAQFEGRENRCSSPSSIFSGGTGMTLSWDDLAKLAYHLGTKKLFKKFLRPRFQDPCDRNVRRTCLSDWKICPAPQFESDEPHMISGLSVTSPCGDDYGHISLHCFPSLDTSVVLHANQVFDNTYSTWSGMALKAILSKCLSGQSVRINDDCKPVAFPPFYRKMPCFAKENANHDNFETLVEINKLLGRFATSKECLVPLFASQMISPVLVIQKLKFKNNKPGDTEELRPYRFVFQGIPTTTNGEPNDPMGAHSQTAEPDINSGAYVFKSRGPGLPVYASKGTIKTPNGPKQVDAVVISNTPYVSAEVKGAVDVQVQDEIENIKQNLKEPKLISGRNYVEENANNQTTENLGSLLMPKRMLDESLQSAGQIQAERNSQESQNIGAGFCGLGFHRVLGYGCVPNAPGPFFWGGPRYYPWRRRPYYL